MKAMILAAGRGMRMRPLTDNIPKALIEVNGVRLIERHLINIREAGIVEVVVNLGHLGRMIQETIKDGSAYGVHITYSDEGANILETGGGIIKALPLLGDDPFFVVNTDVYTDYKIHPVTLKAPIKAHLVMVDNPEHNRGGDFALTDDILNNHAKTKLTFSGMGYYTPALFNGLPLLRQPLVDILKPAIEQSLISGEHYRGEWIDVGTMERLDLAQTTDV